MINLREARRLLAGTKKPAKAEPPEEKEKEPAMLNTAIGSALNSMVQAQMSERLMQNLEEWMLNGGAGMDVSPLEGGLFSGIVTGRRSAADPATATIPRTSFASLRDWNQLLDESSLMEQMQQMEIASLARSPIIQQIADRAIAMDPAEPGSERTVVRFQTTNTLTRAMESVNPSITDNLPATFDPEGANVHIRQLAMNSLVQRQAAGMLNAEQTAEMERISRMNSLIESFEGLAQSTLRREGWDRATSDNGVEVRHREGWLTPDRRNLEHLFNTLNETAPGTLRNVRFHGIGDRRIAMLIYLGARQTFEGGSTDTYVVGFPIRQGRSCVIRPVHSEQSLHENLGYFIERADRGWR
jgi:hypothetical protein